MSSKIRAFIAIAVTPCNALQGVRAELSGLGIAVRPVPVGPLHLTLKFLGDVPKEFLPGITQTAESVSQRYTNFDLRIAGLGAFPNPRRPSVIWAGVQSVPLLTALAHSLDEQMASHGISRETRSFHPHLTLARVKRRPPGALFDLLKEHRKTEFGVTTVRSAELYESELRPNGPVYTPLESFGLKATAPQDE